MTPRPVSLIIVSRQRPAALMRAIAAVRQLDHPLVELIVVADSQAAAQVAALGLPIKLHPFDEANISAARNAGLALAAGEVVAFLDDDAVPEPTWLSRLTAPFADPRVVAATGFVRGRNGISYQWRACEVDALGQDHPLAVPDGTSLHPGHATRAVKTQGTNCAFRRADLLAIGGFDPAYAFYLDEADVNLRLAPRGLTAVVSDAQVHHGFAASARRRGDRVPLSLSEIGASTMVFLRRHAAERDWAQGLELLRHQQRRGLIAHMVAGRIEPRDVELLQNTLEQGIVAGGARLLAEMKPMTVSTTDIAILPGTGPRKGVVLSGWSWQRKALEHNAKILKSAGACVTVIRLSPTALYHRHRFDTAGYWRQTGGLFGRAMRDEPLFSPYRLANRVLKERLHLQAFRPVE